MTEEDKRILQELKQTYEWMKDSTPSMPEECCKDFIDHVMRFARNSGDYREVCVVLHMKEGGSIKVNNECWLSLLRQKYMGATFDIDINDQVIVLCFTDNNGRYHQCTIPVWSISWIDTYSEEVEWISECENASRDEIKQFDENLEHWREITQRKDKQL